MKKITCPCGKIAEWESKFTGSVGEVSSKTGYDAVICHDGVIIYLCPGCTKRAKKLAKELFEIVKNDNLSLIWLLS